jgi:hypothetical protein
MRDTNSDRIVGTSTPVPVPFGSPEHDVFLHRIESAVDDVVSAAIEVAAAATGDRRLPLRRLANASWRLWQLALRALRSRRMA